MLYLIEYDNGEEYEMHEVEPIGIFNDLEEANDYLNSCGFIKDKRDDFYYIRTHDNVPGQCVAHSDYARISVYEINKPKDDIEYFEHHYKYVIPFNVLNSK